MGSRARLAYLSLAVVLVSGCSGRAGPPSPSPISLATPRTTASPCAIAVTHLGAFTGRLAGDLAALRPIVVSKTFRAGDTLSVAREASASLTASGGLERKLQSCEATADLAPRIVNVRVKAETALGTLLTGSMGAAKVQRAAAVVLLGLLPEVLALSKAAKSEADALGVEVAVAEVPAGATKPVGSLLPLSSPTPRPTAKPRATPRPTGRPATGSSGSGWTEAAYNTAVVYQASAVQTYTEAVPGYIARLMSMERGGSPDENTALSNEADVLAKLARDSINGHLAFMRSHPAARCFRDAYAADRKLATAYLQYVQPGGFPQSGPTLRMTERRLSDTEAQAQAFFSRFSSYFADCR